MGTKSSQLQIRVSPSEKETLKRLAAAEGLSVSAYVLSRVLPSARKEFEERVEALKSSSDRKQALEELIGFLGDLVPERFEGAVTSEPRASLSPVARNQLAAVLERETVRRGLTPPDWVTATPPLEKPHFAPDLAGLRPHLMRIAPPAFKRRRLFVPEPGDPRT